MALEEKRRLVEAFDLVIVMRWDTDKTDVDLHVNEPVQTVSYNSRTSWQGGQLDRDVTSGFGPETYTLRRAAPGKYSVRVHYYSGKQPSNVELTITYNKNGVGERTEARRYRLEAANDWADVLSVEFPLQK